MKIYKYETCPTCKGHGSVREKRLDGIKALYLCGRCDGSGTITVIWGEVK